MKKKFNKDDLIEILIKKASGFYYSEEVYEYEKTQNKPSKYENQLNIFENSEYFDKNENFDDRVNNTILYSHDKIKVSNEKESKLGQNSQNLALSKKKVTTHFIPPDMLAIKILFEIFGEKVGENEIEKMTDDELIKLRNKLIGELKNEDSKNS